MNELIEVLADLLRGGIVIEKDGDNVVRIRLEASGEGTAVQPTKDPGPIPGEGRERLTW